MTYGVPPVGDFSSATLDRIVDALVADDEFVEAVGDAVGIDEDGSIGARVAVIEEAPLNVKAEAFGAVGDGVSDDTAAINAALDVATAANKGHIYVPPGEYDISDPLQITKNVRFECGGSYATVFNCLTADAEIWFDQNAANSGRGPASGGFRVNMAEISTRGFYAERCVNKSFEDIRIDNPATNGVAMLLADCQNCDFDGVDMEGKGGGGGPAGTRGLVFDRGASGNNFYGFRANDFTSFHVSYRMTEAAASGVDVPRHNWLWGVMIERQDPPYVGLIYHAAGADNGIVGGNLSLGSNSDADPGAEYPIVLCDNGGDTLAGDTATRMTFRDLKVNGEVWAGVRRAVAFEFDGTFFYANVEDCTVGNVQHLMRFNNEGSHCVKESGNFVDELATSRYAGGAAGGTSSAYMRANFASSSAATLNTRRGQINYFYAGGALDLTNIDEHVETGFLVTIQFYASRTVKHGTGNIFLSGGADMAATANDMLYLVHDGAGNFHEVSRVVK